MKQYFNQKKSEEPGVPFKGPTYKAVVVNVVESGWESFSKVSVWIEDINTSEECIMGSRPAPQSLIAQVLNMKPQWLYRIENFTTEEFGNASPMQIRLTENSRIIPMPNDLNIKLPFKPKRITSSDNVQGIDVEGKLIWTGLDGFVTLKIRDKFDQYFMVTCPRSNEDDNNLAKSNLMKTVRIKNCQYSRYNENTGNYHVSKRFDAVRFEA